MASLETKGTEPTAGEEVPEKPIEDVEKVVDSKEPAAETHTKPLDNKTTALVTKEADPVTKVGLAEEGTDRGGNSPKKTATEASPKPAEDVPSLVPTKDGTDTKKSKKLPQ